MAKFETFGDFPEIPFSVEIECPLCGKPFDLDLDVSEVKCPHCGELIAIEHES